MWIIALAGCVAVFVWASRRIAGMVHRGAALGARVAELEAALTLETAHRVRLQEYLASSERVVRAPVVVAPVVVPPVAESAPSVDLDSLDAPRVVTRRRKPGKPKSNS